jgi:hypothetical protein
VSALDVVTGVSTGGGEVKITRDARYLAAADVAAPRAALMS